MNCREGDLAIIVRAERDPRFLGKIVRVLKVFQKPDGPVWTLEQPLVGEFVEWDAVYDCVLRPIRDIDPADVERETEYAHA